MGKNQVMFPGRDLRRTRQLVGTGTGDTRSGRGRGVSLSVCSVYVEHPSDRVDGFGSSSGTKGPQVRVEGQ